MSLRRFLISLVLSLLLIGCFAGPASAATPSAISPGPVTPCLQVNPDYQKVPLGQSAQIYFSVNFSACNLDSYSSAAYPPKVDVIVSWGDGDASVVPICVPEPGWFCLAVVPMATHTYAKSGSYTPISCLIVANATNFNAPCVAVKVDVVSITNG